MSKKKIDYTDSESCRFLQYEDMKEMTINDAIQILGKTVNKYHACKNDKERMWLPRAHLIRAYEIAIDAMKKIEHKNEW